MNIIVADDERLAMENMLSLLRKLEPDAEITGFTETDDVFEYIENNHVDIAFLDIEMGEYNGIELAKKCKDIAPYLNIIFVTGYSEYMIDAFRLHASGYLVKPVRSADLKAELDNLRHPPEYKPKCRIRIQTFGFFEVFVDSVPLKFTRTKCKECLAYLIDRRGARVTYAELAAVLWEDCAYDQAVQNNTQKIVSDLAKTLREIDLEKLIIRSRQDIAVDTTLVDCDYYAVLEGDMARLNTFMGEYMSNYSWAEFTVGELIRLKEEMKGGKSEWL